MNRILFATLSLVLCTSMAAAAEPQPRKPAPDFVATGLNGRQYKLSDLKGKIVVLESYNLDCPFCANHFKSGAMQELQAEMALKGVVWLLVNSTNTRHPSYRSPEAAQKEIKENHISATAWINDSSGKLGKLFDLKTTPHMIVIDQQGMIAYDGAIDNRPESEGDPRKARNYVREAIAALIAGKNVPVVRTKPYGCAIKYAE